MSQILPAYPLEETNSRNLFHSIPPLSTSPYSLPLEIQRLWIRPYGVIEIRLLHCALASCGTVYCNRSCLWVCVSGRTVGRTVSEPYYSQRAQCLRLLSAFFFIIIIIILIYLLVFESPPNSAAYPHELKTISRSYHTPFPVIKHRFYLHLYY